MGTPVPDDWPEIEPTSFYCVKVETYPTGLPTDPCGLFAPAFFSGCILGATINAWVSADLQCSSTGLFLIPFFEKQRIIEINGPFATMIICVEAGCPP